MSRLFYHVMQDIAGNLLHDVSGTMRLAGTGTIATIYGDEAQTVILPNPMTNHPSYASFKCFLAPGDYDFYMAKPGYSFETLTGIQGYGSMAQQDYHNVIITGGTATFTGGVAFTDRAGDNMRSIYDNLMAAGGTNRLFIEQIGDAPSLFRGPLQVGTQPAMRADPISGRVGIHVFDPGPLGAALAIRHTRATEYGLWVQASDSDSGGQPAIQFANVAGTGCGSITTTASTTAYNTTSDARLKEDVQPLDGALDVVRALHPVSYRWKTDGSPGRGLLAGQVQEVIPDGVVTGDRGAIDDEGNILPQQIDYSKLVPWLVGAVKELTQQVDMLTAQLAAARPQP